jgi:myo-inositol-1(or 4)-monophosphatase
MSAPDPTVPDPTVPDLIALRSLAERAARAAGDLVRTRPPVVEVAATKSTPTDVVTRMDADAEQLLRATIRAARPRDAVLGEEGGLDAASATGLTWVVDPIDGTVNYLYGLPGYTVSVAVVSGPPDDPERWRVLAGAVHDVVGHRTWTAHRGGGATCDGVVVRPGWARAVPDLAQCLVATGFGYDARRRRRQAEVLVEVLPRVRDLRRSGSAALDLCRVASGEVDLYYERGLNPWDLAAGSLVASEAGAVVRGLAGRGPSRDMLVAGPARPAHDLLLLLERADAARD